MMHWAENGFPPDSGGKAVLTDEMLVVLVVVLDFFDSLCTSFIAIMGREYIDY